MTLAREVQRGGYDLVTTEELKGLVDARPEMVLIDAMPLDHYQGQHIPGAVQFLFPIPEMDTWDATKTDGKTLEQYVELLGPDKGRLIITYCGFVKCTRSHNAAMWAVRAGYTNVKRHPGGIFAWKGAGHATVAAQ